MVYKLVTKKYLLDILKTAYYGWTPYQYFVKILFL